MNIKLGSAPDSWGVWFPDDLKQTPWHRFLDEVKQAGYEYTELGPYGYLPTDPEVLKVEFAKRDLICTGSMLPGKFTDDESYPKYEEEFVATCALLVSANAKYIGIIEDCYTDLFTGEQLGPSRLDEKGWKRLIETTHKLGDLARERYGLTLLFHHHADTHVEYEDQIDKLLEDTDPGLVALCLDTGHFAYRGGDSAALMKKHHARIPYLHVKSVDPQVQKKMKEETIPFAVAVGMDLFCEPSVGAVDFIVFRDVLQELDYDGYVIVEQDMYPAPFDKPLPIAKRTGEYLRSIGIA